MSEALARVAPHRATASASRHQRGNANLSGNPQHVEDSRAMKFIGEMV